MIKASNNSNTLNLTVLTAVSRVRRSSAAAP